MATTASSTTSISRTTMPSVAEQHLRRGSAIMAIAGLGFVGYAMLFIARSFSSQLLELGIGHNEVDVTGSEIKSFSPSLHHYLLHLQLGTGGFIAATGLSVAALSWFGVRRGERWAFGTALVVPVVALAIALPAHYPYHLDTLGHLGLIYADTVLFLVGASLAGRTLLGVHPAR
jgi:hypothetical protein